MDAHTRHYWTIQTNRVVSVCDLRCLISHSGLPIYFSTLFRAAKIRRLLNDGKTDFLVGFAFVAGGYKEPIRLRFILQMSLVRKLWKSSQTRDLVHGSRSDYRQ